MALMPLPGDGLRQNPIATQLILPNEQQQRLRATIMTELDEDVALFENNVLV